MSHNNMTTSGAVNIPPFSPQRIYQSVTFDLRGFWHLYYSARGKGWGEDDWLLQILADDWCQVFLHLLRYKLRGGDYGILEGAGANAIPRLRHTCYGMPQQPLDGFSASL